ncbi:MAG TPA: enoyl-ACP reductase, partial [Candidatus Deferrimicrobiaceae bacterium]|nr:enoyl-ACP reductase [Candidatus Deferrimicrobiaceae bacterium]
WGIARALHREGARIALTYQNERMSEPVKKLAAELGEDTVVTACDVTVEGDIDRCFDALAKPFSHLDGLVHSIAFARREELGGKFVDTSWEGYALAQQVSAWSLIGLSRAAAPLMEGRDAGVVCLSYYGAEKVVPNYNVMGVAKAALEASVRYLAADLGPDGVRVNAISAGPIRTLAAAGIAGFKKLYGSFAEVTPLRSNITIEDVGKTAVWLASDLSSAVTGEVVYVDGGFNVLGVPLAEE